MELWLLTAISCSYQLHRRQGSIFGRRLFTGEDELSSEVLSFLYRNHRNVYPTADISEALHGKAAPLSKSGVDRAIKLLINQGLVASRNACHPRSIESLSKQETLFYITQKGLVYCESTEGTSSDAPSVSV
jgi:hypothetical protein